MKVTLIPDNGGKRIEIESFPALIGRSSQASVTLDDAAVSRNHCSIRTSPDGTIFITDLQSHNGVLVNGAKVDRSVLMDGDLVEIGSTVFTIQIDLEDSDNDPKSTAGKTKTLPGLSSFRRQGGEVVWQEGAVVVPEITLIEVIGRGGFGEVWKAMHDRIGLVAIKRVPVSNPIEKEERALAAMEGIRHHYFNQVYGCRRMGNDLVIALELGDESLDEIFHRRQKAGQKGVEQKELFRYITQIAEAVDYLNLEHRMLHRDIKPSNILIVKGVAKLADFGLAKLLEESQAQHSGIASFDFAPPEFFEGKMSMTSDQFGLAATYSFCLTGERPFAGMNLRQIALAHAVGKLTLDSLPEAQQPIVARALARNPLERFPCCNDFIADLRPAVFRQT